MHRSQGCCGPGLGTVQQLELSFQGPTDVLAAHTRAPAYSPDGGHCELALHQTSMLVGAALKEYA